MLKSRLAMTAACALLASAAFAQTSPSPSPPAATPPATTAPAVDTAKPEQNLAGQGKWRASKLMGVDIYGPDDEKVGDVTEVVFDKGGKVEMVAVSVGGFLGLGAKEVAIPFEQVTWSDQPRAAATPAPAPSGGSGTSTPPSAAVPKGPEMYPDHGKISMTKDQLKAAPAVSYVAR